METTLAENSASLEFRGSILILVFRVSRFRVMTHCAKPTNIYQTRVENTFHYVGTLSYNHGAHALKKSAAIFAGSNVTLCVIKWRVDRSPSTANTQGCLLPIFFLDTRHKRREVWVNPMDQNGPALLSMFVG